MITKKKGKGENIDRKEGQKRQETNRIQKRENLNKKKGKGEKYNERKDRMDRRWTEQKMEKDN